MERRENESEAGEKYDDVCILKRIWMKIGNYILGVKPSKPGY